MDQEVDSLSEIVSSVMQDSSIADVDVSVSNNVIGVTSPVITVAADLPSFHYFISEQAKSILALQELQNEVGALLEFRDLVMEAFPHLGQKLSQFNNTLQNTVLSSKWEPGIRVKRKLGQQPRDQEVLVSSLVPRYRSNSQGKSRGDVNSTASSAIQDSGFCTESNKDSSALSSRSKSRETDDELSSLLDTIHIKGTKLKLEVEYMWNRLNRKETSPFCGSYKRRCKSLDDLATKNNQTAMTFECSTVRMAYLESELGDLKRERDSLLKKMSEIESEHMSNLAHTNRLLMELDTISTEKRNLEERLQMATSNKVTTGNFLTANRCREAKTPFAKCQLLKLMQFFKDSGSENSHFQPVVTEPHDDADAKFVSERPTNPLLKEMNDSSISDTKYYRTEGRSGTTTGATSATTMDPYPSLCKPDVLIGVLSNTTSLEEPLATIAIPKEKMLTILNEFDPLELHRYLLTLAYQVEALNAHMQRISKSRLTIFQQLNKYKIENDDLKFQLEEKNIQLEGTKAKVRVLERMRNDKLSYSTSDLMTTQCSAKTMLCDMKSDTMLSNPVSDIAAPSSKLSNLVRYDSRSDLERKSKNLLGRKTVSKIPLKSYTGNYKPPAKVSHGSRKSSHDGK